VSVTILPDLRERRLSGGGPLPDPEFLETLHRARADPNFSSPGGESTRDVLQRARRVLREIDGSTPDGVAVAGTHGGVISIVRWSLGQEFTVDEALAEPMPSVFRLGDIDGTWLLDRL
ncbi:MAG: histidine phosphatase family protein, partial [Actinomycetota bacterium]|nr:histidine phosphatase family protein [Actinomycetota bacterium]